MQKKNSSIINRGPKTILSYDGDQISNHIH